MMKKPFQEIWRISKTAAMSTRAARMSTRSSKDEHESSKDEHEKQQGRAREAARMSGTMLMAQATFPMCVEHYLIHVSLHLMSTLWMPRDYQDIKDAPGMKTLPP